MDAITTGGWPPFNRVGVSMVKGGAGSRKGTGRPRLGGDRYPSGKLKPDNQPNAVVVAQRRALLGIEEGAEKVDLSMSENALDLMLARGWITPERHRAARVYASLNRRIVGGLPRMSQASDPAAPPVDREKLPADIAYEEAVAKFERKQITAGQLAKAERVHLASYRDLKDWLRLPRKTLAVVFDAMLALPEYWPNPQGDVADPEIERLRRIKAALTQDHLRELFGTCCAGNWPQWVILRARGATVIPAHWNRARVLLEEALDVVISVCEITSATPQKRPRRPTADRQADLGLGDEAYFIENGRRFLCMVKSERTYDLGEATRTVEILEGKDRGVFDVKERLLEARKAG
jgi:hypothetical protein